MKQIPILFSTAMVQAKKAGRKTMTRRIIKPKSPEAIALMINLEAGVDIDRCKEELIRCHCPYGAVGDILWTRESFRKYVLFDPSDKSLRTDEIIDFMADGEDPIPMLDGDGDPMFNKDGSERLIPYRPSIHMPKKAARLWDKVVGIRIERLQDITEEDAVKEGILSYQEFRYTRYKDYLADASGYGDPQHDYPTVGEAITSFATLWQLINGVDSWDANPWVWVVEFKVISTTGKPEHLK